MIRKIVKRFLYQTLPLPIRYRYCGVDVSFPRGTWMIKAAIEQNVFEADTLALMHALLRPKTHVFDVGANLGFLSIPMLRNNPDCEVVSFEPSPSYLPHLKQTRDSSDLKSRWSVVGKAVGQEPGEVKFHVGGLNEFTDMIADSELTGAGKTVNVPLTTIDDHWESLGSPEVSVIKIDVEGAEIQVLRGAKKCLNACRPGIIFECSEPHLRAFGHTPAEIFSWVSDEGYNLYTEELAPIKTADEFSVRLLAAYNYVIVPDDFVERREQSVAPRRAAA